MIHPKSKLPPLQSVLFVSRIVLVWWLIATTSLGCPLCEALSGTFSDDLQDAQVAIIAKARTSALDPMTQLYQTDFVRADRLCLAGSLTQVADLKIETLSIEPLRLESEFLLLGYSQECPRTTTPPESDSKASLKESIELAWSKPLPVSNELKRYLVNTPRKDVIDEERLIYFFDHLNSQDLMVRDDAYNECARTPLQTIRSEIFRKRVDLTDVARRLADNAIAAKVKCFYWMLMAEFGNAEHIHLFDELAIPYIELQLSADRRDAGVDLLAEQPIWLAASIAAYCSIAASHRIDGHGLERIEPMILANPRASQSLKYTAISALRVLGDDLCKVPLNRVSRALTLVLNDHESADFVVANLARWKHWDCLPQLIRLFHEVDGSETTVRMPIINFLRLCPLPEAEAELSRMKQVDPQAYRRAFAFFPSIGVQP